jgi:predicted XRE-type DNA-binding protein
MKEASRKLTHDLVHRIKELLASGLYHQHQIAALVGVNQGRISEVKHGHYG